MMIMYRNETRKSGNQQINHCIYKDKRMSARNNGTLRERIPVRILLATVLAVSKSAMLANALTLVSDLPTPSFLVDMDMLHKAAAVAAVDVNAEAEAPSKIRSLHLPKYKTNLMRHPLESEAVDNYIHHVHDDSHSYDVSQYKGQQSALGYLHTSVTRSRSNGQGNENKQQQQEQQQTQQQDSFSFLAELDLGGELVCPEHVPELVMGINNHHVGSYYWARSAGMGASMEAPGIAYRILEHDTVAGTAGKGSLHWQGDGPLDCNSNDGKRSEWVNFLRTGDLVQLLPHCFEDGIMAFEQGDCPIFGFSSFGRPLGSEPRVVCEWKNVS